MHSYMAHNGMLSMVHKRLQQEQAALDHLVESLPGGREAVLAEAAQHHASIDAETKAELGPTPAGTPGPSAPTTPGLLGTSADGLTSYEDPAEAIRKHMGLHAAAALSPSSHRKVEGSPGPELRRRRKDQAEKRSLASLPNPQAGLPQGTSLEPSHTTMPHQPKPPHPLAWSSHERVALLARNIDAMQEELRSNGEKGLVWPANVTYRHFWDFMITPTLVYQLEYPRTDT